jgi:hypothetical protein
MAENTSFITLEESLARKLYLDWRRRNAAEIVVRATKLANAGDWSGAKRAVKELSFAATVEANIGLIDQLSLKAYLLGQSFFTEGRVGETRLARGDESLPVEVTLASATMQVGLEQSIRQVQEKALAVLDEAEAEEVQAVEVVTGGMIILKAIIAGLASKLNTAVASGGAAIDVAANLSTSRLASYGALSQADSMGTGRYQISEVLDRRTCAVCRRMHGKIFSVKPALAQTEQILLTGNPMELASSSPFPSTSRQGVSDLTSMSDVELTGAGWNKPPFHPGCRGIIVPVGDVGLGEMISFIPLATGLTGGEAAAAELAVATSS